MIISFFTIAIIFMWLFVLVLRRTVALKNVLIFQVLYLLFLLPEPFSLEYVSMYLWLPFVEIGLLLLICFILSKYEIPINLKNKRHLSLIGCLLLTIIYAEWFNGAISFGSHFDEFAHYRDRLKPYYHGIPIKIVMPNERGMFPFGTEERGVYVYTGNPLYPTAVTEIDGNLYYYNPGGFGERGNWFQYGIPEGLQVSSKSIHYTMSR
ncbi:hypothetical protein M3225_03660 [Priestia aryabhattai]|uniref:hypothetical protein n=1 Tax=Priestia aryabhattai TaxID=412384 RepID=UPI00203F607B|nr:hypothetical protein [Priestia aryabhattai]MCM3769583.1 hypothetical protein [Priestia aryabhattai]